MKKIKLSFLQMVSFVKNDKILFICCIMPIVIGAIFKFLIPPLDEELKEYFSVISVMSPYFEIFDMLFIMITSIMFCFVSAMVTLEEKDDHIATYMFVTPLGKIGYLLSRFGVTALISLIVTAVLFPIFKLSTLPISYIILLYIVGNLQGIIVALLIVVLSNNKLEGVAVTKIASLISLGVIGPYFIKNKVQYILGFLPSFWMGKGICVYNGIYLIVSLAISLIWIFVLVRKFIKKI